jgi:hypothetical protein
MFRTIAAFSRTLRKLVFPLGRTAIALLIWTNRHTLTLWYRSLRDEIQANGFRPDRLRQLVHALWTVSSDRRTANADELKSISVRPDGYSFEAQDDWVGRSTVEHLLGPIAPHQTVVSSVA